MLEYFFHTEHYYGAEYFGGTAGDLARYRPSLSNNFLGLSKV